MYVYVEPNTYFHSDPSLIKTTFLINDAEVNITIQSKLSSNISIVNVCWAWVCACVRSDLRYKLLFGHFLSRYKNFGNAHKPLDVVVKRVTVILWWDRGMRTQAIYVPWGVLRVCVCVCVKDIKITFLRFGFLRFHKTKNEFCISNNTSAFLYSVSNIIRPLLLCTTLGRGIGSSWFRTCSRLYPTTTKSLCYMISVVECAKDGYVHSAHLRNQAKVKISYTQCTNLAMAKFTEGDFYFI